MTFNPGDIVTDDYTVTRWHGGGTGHYGIPCFKADTDDSAGTPMGGLNPEILFGDRLTEGTRIRVTVEILEEGDGFGNAYYHRKNDYKGECKLCPPKEVKDEDDRQAGADVPDGSVQVL